ncbi:MAG: CoA-binding protein [Bacteroidales bacterium]
MYTRQTIDEFLAQKDLALVGVSRTGKGFGNAVLKALTAKGFHVRLVHPEADSIGGQPCARSLTDVAAHVGGAVLVTPPSQTEKLVREAADAGVRRVWIQQGAESEAAIKACEDRGIEAVHHQCILMFAEPAGGIHRFHRGILALFRRLPK